MTLTHTDQQALAHALALAASQYVEYAAKAQEMPNGGRLAEEWRLRAIQARKWAILAGEAKSIEIATHGNMDSAHEDAAHEDARRIVAQEVIDARTSFRRTDVAPEAGL